MNVAKCQLKYPRLQIRTEEKTIGSPMRTRSEKARETAIAQVTDWSRGWREFC